MTVPAELVKDAREVFGDDTELDQFSRLVESRIIAKDAIKHYEAAVKKVDDQLVQLMAQRDCDKVMHGKHRCQIISKENRKLDKDRLQERLMFRGVPVSVVQESFTEATVVSQSNYLEVREIRDKVAAV